MPLPFLAMGIGAAIGGAVSAGIYLWQHHDQSFSWGGLGANVAGGAVAGGLAPVLAAEATLGWLISSAAVRTAVATGTSVALGAALTRIWKNVAEGARWWQGALQVAALGFAIGLALGPLGKLLVKGGGATADSATSGATVALLAPDDPALGAAPTREPPTNSTNTVVPGGPRGPESNAPATQEQLSALDALGRARKLTLTDLLVLARQVSNRPLERLADLTQTEAEKVIAVLGGRGSVPSGLTAAPSGGSPLSLGGGSATDGGSTPVPVNNTESRGFVNRLPGG